MRNFENWETQDLEITFGLKQIWESKALDNWLQAQFQPDEQQSKILENLKSKLLQNADFWNEDELKLQFIAPLQQVVDYDSEFYKPFSQRKLVARINDIVIGGWVDYMLATGRQKPIEPYFFLHEYKQELKGNSDPKGQLLAELLVSYHLNKHKEMLYGCYVVGRNWFFVVFDGENYAVSDAFVATQDIYQIIAILKKVKDFIATQLNIPLSEAS